MWKIKGDSHCPGRGIEKVWATFVREGGVVGLIESDGWVPREKKHKLCPYIS